MKKEITVVATGSLFYATWLGKASCGGLELRDIAAKKKSNTWENGVPGSDTHKCKRGPRSCTYSFCKFNIYM